MGRSILALVLPALLVCAPSAASAESPEPAARLAVTIGTVEYLGPETDGFQPAPLNLALQPGDRVRTGPESRTEVQFEGGAVVRLGAESEAEVLAVGRSPVLRLLAGRAYGRGPRVPNESLTMEAGLRTVGAAEGSAFRIETGPGEPRGEVTAVAGEIAVETEGERVDLARGVRLPAGERANPVAAVLVRDDFDRWNAERDAALARSAVAPYAPANLPGLADLYGAGSWVRTDEHGYAWRPHVPAGWRPFVHGRWVFRPYYGWVWLAPEPWGYTTYHYGRWVPSGIHGWIWIPGPRFVISVGIPFAPPPPVVIVHPAVPRPPVVVVPRPVVIVKPRHDHVRPRVVVPRTPHIPRPRPPVVVTPPRRQTLPATVTRPALPARPSVVARPRPAAPHAVAAPRPAAPRVVARPRSGSAPVSVAPPARVHRDAFVGGAGPRRQTLPR